MAKIQGAKGGGGGGHTPTESPDSLLSESTAKILLAISEGEIAGGLDDTRIFLDDTPIGNMDGTKNFEGVTWEFRSGSEHQEYIQGIPSVDNEIAVGMELKDDQPYVRNINNTQLSAIRIRLSVPQLLQQHDNGDTTGYRIDYIIELSTDGTGYKDFVKSAFDGKTTSEYQRTHRIDLPKANTGWQIRIRRLTKNQNNARVADKVSIAAIAEVIDAKLRYPNTALLFVTFNARQFNNRIPKISVRPKGGLLVKVPTNYDPINRAYSGAWDGTFKQAATNNPAWVFYDLVLNNRYGCGDRIKASQIEKWDLYKIAQYCDELVPDGRGGEGKEPRFLCDVYIQSQESAYQVLRDIAAIFRGMTFWADNKVNVSADMPDTIYRTFTNANIVNGKPSYSGGSIQNRYTQALVSYTDIDNHSNDNIEPVADLKLQRRYGVRKLELSAIGCTRRSEANRRGRWALLTNANDRMISFATGLEGAIPSPGHIIAVADTLLAGRNTGGRISSVDGRKITLDRTTSIKLGDRLIVNLSDGKSEGRTVTEVNQKVVTVSIEYSQAPQKEAVWVVDSDDLAVQLYRVINISDNGDNTYTINGAIHNPDNYDHIDFGVRIDERPVTVTPPNVQPAPKNVRISSYSQVDQGIAFTTLRVDWEAAETAIAYETQWRRDNGNWINAPRTSTLGFEVNGIYAGRYQVRVRAINASEISSIWANAEETQLNGKEGNPPKPINLRSSSEVWGITLDWGFAANTSDTLKTELQYSSESTPDSMQLLADVPYPLKSYRMSGLKAGIRFYFRARLVDKTGNQSPWSDIILGESSADTQAILDAVADKFLSTEAGKEMQKDIDFNADKVVELESDGFLYEDIIAQHDTQLQRLGRASLEHTEQFGEITFNILAEKGDRRAEIKRVDGVIADEKEARAQSTEVLKAEIGKNSAEIFSMKDVYANDEKSRALQQQLIESKFKFNDSAILEIRETTSTLEASYAEQKLQLESVTQRIDETDKTVKESSARINEAQKTATDAKNAQTEYQKVSESKFDEHQSSIEQSQLTANDALRSIAKISTELSAESARQNENINQANASLKRQDTVIATQTEALTQTKVELTAQLNDNKAYIGRIDTALATETTARTTAETQMKAEIGENKAALTRIEKTVVDNEQSFSQSITQLNSQYESANSSITALSKTVADNKKAQAEENKLIKAELGENAAAIEQRAQTVFDHQGNGSAIYKIQAGINWNGQYHDAKFIIGAEVKNGQVTTQIGFSADTFGILNPSSGKLEPVFFVENGQVFINEAFINQATIERLLIGSTIKSKHWDPVTKKGLMLDFESGKIIASDAEITGKITATSGILNNVVISEDCEIKGTLKANQIEGDVIRVHSIPFDGSITLPAEAFDRTLVIPALTVSTMGSSDFGNITWHVEVKINDRIIISFSPLSSVTGSRSAGGDRYEIYAITAGATSGSGVIYANETPTISYKIVGKVSGYNLIHKIPAQCLVFKS
ncbi:phage tail fiber protein [Moellerella wisconsensis ATCC 35017]|uniref:Phage tail fiber protein n=2 Tax=Moellerella wisconsensis TaxID=158849 RepID=A0A0N0I980_9GAMM|nr:DUF1983 domain-containing protein [Moellerella wisconsensis]KPD01932.1 phage tail fiber protein [Moellerella wisconsensis ATCC 35017]VFS54132.1 Fibronectin type III protein [Moellerella wisconsensis]